MQTQVCETAKAPVKRARAKKVKPEPPAHKPIPHTAFAPGAMGSSFTTKSPIKELDAWELVVWAYQTQKVHIESGRELWAGEGGVDPDWEPRGAARDGTAALEKFGALGCRVDTSGPLTGICGRVHIDALAVEDALKALVIAIPHGRRIVSGIIAFACQGSAPEPCLSVPQPQPVPPDRDTQKIGWHGGRERQVQHKEAVAEILNEVEPITERVGRRGVKVVGAKVVRRESWYCPVQWSPDPSYINGMNQVCLDWLSGMEALTAALMRVPLKDHRITGFVAPYTGRDMPKVPLIEDSVAASRFAIAPDGSDIRVDCNDRSVIDENDAGTPFVAYVRKARTFKIFNGIENNRLQASG